MGPVTSIGQISEGTRKRLAGLLADQRPAWLWSADGQILIWRNSAARLFGARFKGDKLKLAEDVHPIGGQVARLIRLGAVGHASLSRIRFLSGKKPISATCSCTPLRLEDGEKALLIVAVDAIGGDLAGEIRIEDGVTSVVVPAGSEYLLVEADGTLAGGSPGAREHFGAAAERHGETLAHPAGTMTISRMPAGAAGLELMVFTLVPESDEEADAERRATDAQTNAQEIAGTPAALEEEPPIEAETAPHESGERDVPEALGDLTALLDRLAEDEELFGPLGPAEDAIELPPVARKTEAPQSDAAADTHEEAALSDWDHDEVREDLERAGERFAEETEDTDTPDDGELRQLNMALWQVTGRRFTPEDTDLGEATGTPTHEDNPSRDARAAVEQVSRYNFDELSRILTDRVGRERPPSEADDRRKAEAPGALVSLPNDSLMLNRLPLGILIFRDQEILLSNRAMTEMLRYPDSTTLRSAGLGMIFPEDSGEAAVGPVTRLLRHDGTTVAVTARLQSISWQGREAMMLTASEAQVPFSPEGAVREFAETFALARGEGFLKTDRAGNIEALSERAADLFGRKREQLVGQPLRAVIGSSSLPALQAFLERPARFAGGERPNLTIGGIEAGLEILLFAEGQAGIVSGYFGLIRHTGIRAPRRGNEVDPALLNRISRDVRRPLNTIVGFAELIRSAAFGPIENPRYVEYARDIETAGQDIAALVTELDEYARVSDSAYLPSSDDFDLAELLETCVARIRAHANMARVLVRSAISERLPHIRADRASMGQAVLNLLASAIDQTPQGGKVVLSAQHERGGSVTIHVRDSSRNDGDLAERFVVFRDGRGRNGEVLTPVRSSVGLALTRSLLAVNQCAMSIDPVLGAGTLISLNIPADLIATQAASAE